MPETATTTRPARKRTAAKAATPKAAEAPAVEVDSADLEKYVVALEPHPDGDTKSYARFVFPASMKGVCVGTIYGPLGTTEAKVQFVGPKGK